MDGNKVAESVETVGILKPTTEIAKIVSNECLKMSELQEYCKIFESILKNWQMKIQDLVSAKNDNLKIKSEYKSRNKTNITNSESLLQALNELHKYKCELKSSYIAAEKEFKSKNLRYRKIITEYGSAWEDALKLHNENPVVKELLSIEEENTILEREIEKQDELYDSTKIQFIQLKKNIERKFVEKIIEFSEATISYRKLLKSQNVNQGKESLLSGQKSDGTIEFRLFKDQTSSIHSKTLVNHGSHDYTNNCSIDVSMFDDIMVPSENLESHNLEEDDYFFLENEENESSIVLKDQEENSEHNNSQTTMQIKNNKESMKATKENIKTDTVEENESQYFRQQTLENSKSIESDNLQTIQKQNHTDESCINQKNENNREKFKSGSNILITAVDQPPECEEEVSRDVHMEFEESYTDVSSEKQSGNKRVHNSERLDEKFVSLSSEDSPKSGKKGGESFPKTGDQEQNIGSKTNFEAEKNDFKTFSAFFSMGNDHEATKPSIFKLF